MKRFDFISAGLAGLTVLAWGGFIWLGWIGIQGVIAQHIPGYPASSQILYYIEMPALAFVISVLAGATCFRWPGMVWFGRLVMLGMLIALGPFTLAYTGGV